MERELELELKDGRLVTVIFEVTWSSGVYGSDADGNRGEFQEGPELEGFDLIGEDGTEIDVATLSLIEKKLIDDAIDSDLEKVEAEDFEPEFDNERDLE